MNKFKVGDKVFMVKCINSETNTDVTDSLETGERFYKIIYNRIEMSITSISMDEHGEILSYCPIHCSFKIDGVDNTDEFEEEELELSKVNNWKEFLLRN